MKRSIKIMLSVVLGLVVVLASFLVQGDFVQGLMRPAYDTSKCYDSDGGQKYDVKGTTYGKMGARSKQTQYTDYCDGNTLVEYYCSGTKVKKEEQECGKCENGACLLAPAVITQTCPDSELDMYVSKNSEDGKSTSYYSSCFPTYYSKYEGYFIESTNQPLPVLPKTHGHFSVLVAFFDTEKNRDLLLQNSFIPQEIKDKINVDINAALQELFDVYYKDIFSDVLWWLWVDSPPDVTLDYKVKIIECCDNLAEFEDEYYSDDYKKTPINEAALQEYMGYDVVLFIQDFDLAGFGVGKFPQRHPLFRPISLNSFYHLSLDPLFISPGLFFNELFRRNFPVFLSEYTEGETTYYKEDGVLYDITPVYNPRTGEDVTQYTAQGWITVLLSGWYDVDKDGIMDGHDVEIQATPDNVDADWIPDHLDPDLSKNNGPYFWELAE